AVLARAQTCHMLDEATTDLARAVQDADLVVFCTPVDSIVCGVLEAAPLCRPGAILTAVGSTKSAILREVTGRLPKGVAFMGSHPLAGSEKTGPEHARADLFENCLVVVTAPADSPPPACAFVMGFWHALGASVVPMPAEEHDRALAMTSHLPHAAASVLAATLPEEWRWLTGAGFRDTARSAAGRPGPWGAVRAALLKGRGGFGVAGGEGAGERLLSIRHRGKQRRVSRPRR